MIVFTYITIEFWQPLGQYTCLPVAFNKTRAFFLIRIVLIFSLISFCVMVPIVQRIGERQHVEPESDQFIAAYSQLNDGAYQTEIALDYLVSGKNPYQESYVNTLLNRYILPGADFNPAMHYYVYLPGTLYLSLPFRAVMLTSVDFFDQRFVLMALFGVLVLLLPLLATKPEYKLGLLIGVGLNPYFTESVVHGMNDVAVVLFILLTMLSLRKKRIIWATFWFSIACCTKQTAWLLAPFYLVALLQIIPPKQRVRQLKSVTAVALLTAILLIGPFLLWGFYPFVESTLLYAGGAVAEANYPIRGYNLGWFLLLTGVIDSPQADFPFWILQLSIGLPALFILLRRQFLSGQLNRMLLNAALFVIIFGVLSRFFQGNYVAFATSLIVMGVFLQSEPSYNIVATANSHSPHSFS